MHLILSEIECQPPLSGVRQITGSEGIVPKTAFTSNISFRSFLKTTLKFDNLLEKFSELTKSCFPHSCSLLQGKLAKGKTHKVESGKHLFVVIRMCYHPSIGVWQYTWNVANPGSLVQLLCPWVLLGLYCVGMTDRLIAHVVALSL